MGIKMIGINALCVRLNISDNYLGMYTRSVLSHGQYRIQFHPSFIYVGFQLSRV